MKKITAMIAILVVLTALVGCGDSSGGGSDTTPTFQTFATSAKTTTTGNSGETTTTAAQGSQMTTTTTEPTTVTTTAPQNKPSMPETDAQREAVVKQTFDVVLQTVKDDDYNAFAACFADGTDAATIQNNFDGFKNLNSQYDQVISNYIVDIDDTSMLANLLFSITTGTYPNTHVQWEGAMFMLVCTNDGWKMSMDNALLQKVDAAAMKAYPQGLVTALNSGRNAMQFNSALWFYKTPNTAMNGCINVSLRYMWQDEDGDVHLALHLNNGTNANRSIYNITVDITDNSLGTVISGRLEEPFAILPMTNKDGSFPLVKMTNQLVEIEIPAENVQTGTQAWTSLHYEINNSNQ